HIKEEVLYREALAMGLDKDDSVVRRRMRQKMRFLFEDVAARAEPAEEELQAYLDENAAYFRVEPRFSFTHVYLSPKRRGESLPADAARLVETLNQSSGGPDIEALGDPTMLSRSHEGLSLSDVGAIFGQGFARALPEIAPGRWRGPIPSAYGMHVVLVRSRVEGRVPALNEVRDTVRRELQNVRREEVNEATYRRLLERYTVVVEPPPAAAGQARAEESP
ncbi:MAG: peptidyl-prolyl cis-trans isomerase, partial [bacterium]|nr:peptidyl-prolyl cis-trans isomerase [bacterium]